MNSPYTPPKTSLEKPPSESLVATDVYGNPLPQLLNEPRPCSAGAGWTWITKAFEMYKDNFLLWTGMGLVLLVIMLVAGFIPIIGGLAGYFMLIFIGGLMLGCAAQARGDELRFDHLFEGFRNHLEPLLILSLLYFVGTMVIIVIGVIIFIILAAILGLSFDSFFNNMSAMGQNTSLILLVLLAILLMLALMMPILMAIWFAPALIVLHGMSATTAMKKSFQGCLKNMVPFLVYGLVLLIIMPLIVLLTLGFGLLVVFPFMMICYYTSYRDVWTDQPWASQGIIK